MWAMSASWAPRYSSTPRSLARTTPPLCPTWWTRPSWSALSTPAAGCTRISFSQEAPLCSRTLGAGYSETSRRLWTTACCSTSLGSRTWPATSRLPQPLMWMSSVTPCRDTQCGSEGLCWHLRYTPSFISHTFITLCLMAVISLSSTAFATLRLSTTRRDPESPDTAPSSVRQCKSKKLRLSSSIFIWFNYEL